MNELPPSQGAPQGCVALIALPCCARPCPAPCARRVPGGDQDETRRGERARCVVRPRFRPATPAEEHGR